MTIFVESNQGDEETSNSNCPNNKIYTLNILLFVVLAM